MSIVGRDIQLTKDYTPGNAIFKQGRRGTVIEAPSRKDRKWKVKFNNDIKKYRLIKGCDLQLYEGVAFSPNSESQTEADSFEYTKIIYYEYVFIIINEYLKSFLIWDINFRE